MNILRDRVKQHFPSVLLTLLSIVQALALELLWSHMQENKYPLEMSLDSLTVWTQIAATFLGLVTIWVVYASNAMRFRWVPKTSDSVYPFFIGLMEFLLVDHLGPGKEGLWLIFMAIIFGAMVWVTHQTFRRARQDGSNDAFFADVSPATMRDHYPHIVCTLGIFVAGVYQHMTADRGIVIFMLLFGTMFLLAWQLYASALFWESSLAEDSE
ncbi:MAG: hypothetical protein KJP04_09690 [Arenicella sp.]|nr:hypothetical protein [Arenicella sp.]